MPINTVPIDTDLANPFVGDMDILGLGPIQVIQKVNVAASVPVNPSIPRITMFPQILNRFFHVWKNVYDPMPQKFIVPQSSYNPTRTFKVLPSPQIGLRAVVETDNSLLQYQGQGLIND